LKGIPRSGPGTEKLKGKKSWFVTNEPWQRLRRDIMISVWLHLSTPIENTRRYQKSVRYLSCDELFRPEHGAYIKRKTIYEKRALEKKQHNSIFE
jgi:hypothetical protein